MNINLDVLCSLASISSMFSVSVPSAARAPREWNALSIILRLAMARMGT
jgi:hypothetical protein